MLAKGRPGPLCCWQSVVLKPLRRGAVIFIILLIIEYLVVPEFVGASKDLYLLGTVNAAWVIAGVVLEGASLFCYGLTQGAAGFVRQAGPVQAVPHRLRGGGGGAHHLHRQAVTAGPPR